MDTPAHFPNSKFSLIPNTIKNEKAGLNHLAYYQCRSDNTHRRSSCIRLLATVGNEKFQRAYKHRKRTGKTRRRIYGNLPRIQTIRKQQSVDQ